MPDWLCKIVIPILALLTIAFVFVVVWANVRLVEEAKVRAELVASVPSTSPILKEFERLFSDTRHEIESGYHRFPNGESRWVNIWRGEAWLYGRHALAINFPFGKREDGTIKLLDEPTFYFSSLTESGIDEEGQWYRMGESMSFNTKDWKRLVDAGGDFSVLGLTVIKDSPVEHFEQWRQR